ncbi:hypothetical protein EDB81DRAFT_893068 [Dactylonectria macrodidyma]|uniref:Uncharacterized protein n=1 Tax=Dactylonectria macrodidyma TaxID=307937 RepID=A0A9P9D8X1_9HYPO|nr:hypothetical protein EDB81DRAFT_893068 [Dactylonectria macrodidyma]
MSVPLRIILVLPAGTAQRTVTRVGQSLLDPDEAWHSAAQLAAQQLRACVATDRGPAAALAHAPALTRLSESAEPTLEERKVAALEAIAEAARLWTQLNKPNE